MTKKKAAAPVSARRSEEALAHAMDAVVGYLTLTPGVRMEQLGEALAMPTKDLVLPVQRLLMEGRIRREGEKRATKYYPAAVTTAPAPERRGQKKGPRLKFSSPLRFRGVTRTVSEWAVIVGKSPYSIVSQVALERSAQEILGPKGLAYVIELKRGPAQPAEPSSAPAAAATVDGVSAEDLVRSQAAERETQQAMELQAAGRERLRQEKRTNQFQALVLVREVARLGGLSILQPSGDFLTIYIPREP